MTTAVFDVLKHPASELRRVWYRRVGLRRVRSALGGQLVIESMVVDMPNRFMARARHEGRPVFVKLRRHAGSLRREAEAHEVTAALGLPTARCLAYLPGSPEVLVTHAVDGRPLNECADDASWAAAGAALRRFHDPAGFDRLAPFEGDVDWVAGCERRIGLRAVRAAAIAGDDAAMVERAAARARHAVRATAIRRAVIHGDMQAVHVLVGDHGVTLIDLDLCGGGDPWYDLAVLGSYAGPHRVAVLRGYDASLVTDAAFLEVEHAYVTARFLSAIVWRADHGFDPRPFVERLSEHERETPPA